MIQYEKSDHGCKICNFGAGVPNGEWCPHCGFGYRVDNADKTAGFGYKYEILELPPVKGVGWSLRLTDNGDEVGGGWFMANGYPAESVEESKQYAYEDALRTALEWLRSRS